MAKKKYKVEMRYVEFRESFHTFEVEAENPQEAYNLSVDLTDDDYHPINMDCYGAIQ